MIVFCTAMNSFTPDEDVEKHIEKSDDLPLCTVDSPLQGSDITLAWSKMQIQSHLFPICTRCAQEVRNDKGPVEGPLSNIALSPLGWKWLRSCLKTLSNFFPVDHRPKSREIISPAVLILQVIGVFPNINPKNWCSFYLGNIHQWIVLIGS